MAAKHKAEGTDSLSQVINPGPPDEPPTTADEAWP